MDVITSHTNADFDTFASMIAAKKLYPSARLVLPGSMERKLRDAVKTMHVPYELDRIRDIDLEEITRLILVDVRSPERIGRFAEVARRPGVEVHVYDHHPPADGDIRGSVEVTEPYGSTTTVLTQLVKDKGIRLTPEEATILMAGIYEDTGSLSYPSTTTKDFEAASYLLEAGADLGAVSDLLRTELTPEEVSLLNEFLRSETTYSIGGTEVVVAEGYMDKYKGDIAGIAHKIRDIEGMSCLFMLVDSGDRVHLVVRSAVPQVNAGVIARMLGGGGTPERRLGHNERDHAHPGQGKAP
jgi:tRNA nucleotidyltransferase (CCA-adding enzyme)